MINNDRKFYNRLIYKNWTFLPLFTKRERTGELGMNYNEKGLGPVFKSYIGQFYRRHIFDRNLKELSYDSLVFVTRKWDVFSLFNFLV